MYDKYIFLILTVNKDQYIVEYVVNKLMYYVLMYENATKLLKTSRDMNFKSNNFRKDI